MTMYNHRIRSSALIGVAVALMGLGMGAIPYAAAATTGQVNYFNVSSGACTATAWTGPTASDGNPPGMFPNNVGGPPITAMVGTGMICIQVVLTGATPNTSYVITANKLSGSLTVTTDASGNGSNEAVFSAADQTSTACTTVPLDMSPSSPYTFSSGINHVWVGVGTATGTTVTCSSTTTTTSTTTTSTTTTTTTTSTTSTRPPPGVPQFSVGSAGFALIIAAALVAVMVMKKKQLRV